MNHNNDENISEYKKALIENKNIISIRNKTIPNEFKDKVELYSIRYISSEYEVEGYASFPKNKEHSLKDTNWLKDAIKWLKQKDIL